MESAWQSKVIDQRGKYVHEAQAYAHIDGSEPMQNDQAYFFSDIFLIL